MRLTYERSIVRRGERSAFMRPTYCTYTQGRVLVADELQNCIHVVEAGSGNVTRDASHPPLTMLPVDRIEDALGATEEETAAL